jgi:hypothetical protein
VQLDEGKKGDLKKSVGTDVQALCQIQKCTLLDMTEHHNVCKVWLVLGERLLFLVQD